MIRHRNRDGTRPNLPSIPRGRSTLPPLPSLQQPVPVLSIDTPPRPPDRSEAQQNRLTTLFGAVDPAKSRAGFTRRTS
jgi:hypothetical protein